MMKNIFAYTETGHDYPAYVSINRHSDNRVSISVRSSGTSDASVIDLPDSEFNRLCYELSYELSNSQPVDAR